MDESQESLARRLGRIESHLAELRTRLARVEEAQEVLKTDKAATRQGPPPLPFVPFGIATHVPDRPEPSLPEEQTVLATSFIPAPLIPVPARQIESPTPESPAPTALEIQPTPLAASELPSAASEQPKQAAPALQTPPDEIPAAQIEETISDLLVLKSSSEAPAPAAPQAPPIHFVEESGSAQGAGTSPETEPDIAKLDKSIQAILHRRRESGAEQKEKEWVKAAEVVGDSTPAKPSVHPAPMEGFDYPPPAREAAPSFDFKEFMQRLNLLPPTGEGSLEIQVGTWWATRAGALMAIIGVVFFGVYASQYTTHLVRFMELMGISVGVTALGLWLERKVEKFGAVLFGAGLAMLYFCAFAAYAVPAVKIIPAASGGVIAQFTAIALIIGCALWRGSPVIATMGIFLGYVASFFAFREGLNDHALLASVTLAVGAVYFYLAKGWPLTFQISIPAHYFIYLLIFGLRWGPAWGRMLRSGMESAGSAPDYWIAQAWLIGPMILYGAADFVAAQCGKLMLPWPRRLAQTCNTACAIALGFLVTIAFFRANLTPYYFTFGAILLAGALVYYFVLQHNSAFLMHAYFIKGTALITVGLMCAFDARTRWISLAVESLVLLFSARRSRLKVVEIFMVLVWFCSFGFFAHELLRLHYIQRPPQDWQTYGYAGMAYLLLSAFFFCLQARWLIPAEGASSALFSRRDEIVLRNILNAIYSFFIGLVALMVARVCLAIEYFPLGTIAIGVAVALVGFAGRHWIPFAAAVLPLLLAHVSFWRMHAAPEASHWLWINGLGVAGITLAAGMAMNLWRKRRWPDADDSKPGAMCFALGALNPLWMISLQILFYKVFPVERQLLAGVLTSLALAALSGALPVRRLADWSPLAMAFALGGAAVHWRHLPAGLKQTEYPLELGLAAVGAVIFACAFAALPYLKNQIRLGKENDGYQTPHVCLAAMVVAYALAALFGNEYLLLALTLSGLFFAMLTRWPGLKPSLAVAMGFFLVAHALYYQIITHALQARIGRLALLGVRVCDRMDPNGALLAVFAIIAGVATVAMPLLARGLAPGLRRMDRRALETLCGALALVLFFVLAYQHRATMQTYVTVCWGVSAFAVIFVGFLARSKPMRIEGLAALALCIVRAFAVDIDTMLARIFAFMTLGAALLVVGFIYNRYREAVARWDEEG